MAHITCVLKGPALRVSSLRAKQSSNSPATHSRCTGQEIRHAHD
jgi:hypothetical protein